jgi:hypothetical protein
LRQSEPSKSVLPFLVAVAIFGLAFVPFLLLQPNLQVDNTPFRQPIVGALYSLVCVLGIVAVFYPGRCLLMFQKPSSPLSANKPAASVHFSGHHPDCEKFQANRIKLGGTYFCAACSGLLVGAIAALGGIALFSFGFFELKAGGIWVLAVGEVLLVVGLAQVKLGGYMKMAANTLFVVGSLIFLIVVDLTAQNLPLDVYALGLIAFMLWLRISLSENHNKKVCLACGRC